jgi:hypothetical protein
MQSEFAPPRQAGIIFQSLALALLTAISLICLTLANRTQIGSPFTIYLLGFFATALPVPMLAYRLYALLRSSYQLRPSALELSWGLRSEHIPVEQILWISPEHDLERRLPRPLIRWPGGLVGSRRIRPRGEVEYMASRGRRLIIIGTANKLYAVSPEDASGFLQSYQYMSETGNLSPEGGQSVYPASLIGSVWTSNPARLLIMFGLALSLGLLAWTTAAIPAEQAISIESPIEGQAERVLTTAQLLLIPVVNAAFYLGDLFLGLMFYRRPENRSMAFMLWTTSILTSIFFLVAFGRILL